ncbi:MAG: PKD domain-containing protein [Bacteroidota bacterium]
MKKTPENSYILFAENKGQWNEKVLYEGKFRGGKVFLEKKGFSYVFFPKDGLEELHHHRHSQIPFTYHAVKMNFKNANSSSLMQQADSNSFYENYFLGNDQSKWASHVKSYKQITYTNLYKGINARLFSEKNNFRFDFIISPGANTNELAMDFTGQNNLSLVDGDLILNTDVGNITQQAPYAYQVIKGKEIPIECHYVLEKNTVKFKIASTYNKNFPLIIDPTLVFATYTGSTADNWGMTATYDAQGNAYTAGMCFGPGYPLSPGAFQINYMGGVGYGGDISISKFNSAGSNLIYSTYLGGSDNESPQSIVVDNIGELIVFGRSSSVNFPITSSVIQSANAGGTDLIITKFNTTGTGLVASTFLGGSGDDGVNSTYFLGGLHYNYSDDLRGSVIVDDSNNVYIAASTASNNFPVTSGCFQSSLGGVQDACVAKLVPGLNSLIYSTYYGGSGMDGAYDIALNPNNQLYVTGGTNSPNFHTTPGSVHASQQGGIDGFISLFSYNGNTIQASTYIGTGSYDQSYYIQIDKNNKVYVFGQTEGAYPVSTGVYKNVNSGQFIHCLNAGLTSSFFSTVIGSGDGFPDISPSAFLVDMCGNIYLSGWGGLLYNENQIFSSTAGLPITSNAFLNVTDESDFYFMVLNPDAVSLQYATFFGGNSSLEHVDGGTSRFDKSGAIYQAICESCGGNDDMPATPTAWSTQNGSSNCNNAVVKFAFSPNLTVAQSAINTNNIVGCAPFTVNLTNNSVNGVNYFWNFGDGNFSTAFAPVHTYTAAGNYIVQLIANNNATCNKWDTTYVSIKVLPLQNLSPLLTVQSGCAPLTVNFNNTNSPSANYFWNFGDGTTANTYSTSHTYTAVGVYTVQLISQNILSCNIFDTISTTINVVSTMSLSPIPLIQNGCAPLSVNFNNTNSAAADVSYSWNFGDGSSSSLFSPAHTYTNPGTFTVQLISFSSNSCNLSDTVYSTLTVFPPLSIPPMLPQNMCLGDSITLNLLSPTGCTFSWTPNLYIDNQNIQQPRVSPPLNQAYHVIVEKNGCMAYDTVNVVVNKNDIKILIDPLHTCIDDTIILKANHLSSNYNWSNGENSSQINVFQPGWYYLTTLENNCLAKDSIRIDSFVHVNINDGTFLLCKKDVIQLTAPYGNFIYSWKPDYKINDTTIYNPQVNPLQNTTYSLSLYNGPCVSTATFEIKVMPLPTLTVTPKQVQLFYGEQFELHCFSDTICFWSIDYLLSCNYCNNPVVTAESNITYYSTVQNEYGCKAMDSVEIKVTPTLYIPNSFSPNGDLLNDIFKPEYTGFVEIELLIFDRWGELIYKTNDPLAGWNGKYKDINCELGVYIYKLNAKDIYNETIEKVGHVTLIR